jgi:hypothetical protein
VHKLLKMFEIFLSLMIGLTIFAWYEMVKKREIAIEASKRIASNFNLQLLDDSVFCSSFKIIKTSSWPMIKRVYNFKVSSTKQDSIDCHLTLLGGELVNWYIPPYPKLN